MSAIIKTSDLWAEVIKVAKEQPDHVYDRSGPDGKNKCSYQRYGQPSCIVGHALHRLGMQIHELEEFDDLGDSGIGDIVLYHSGELFEIDDRDALEFVCRTQDLQDQEETWQNSVARSLPQSSAEPSN